MFPSGFLLPAARTSAGSFFLTRCNMIILETFQVSLICKQCGLPVIQVVSDSLTVGLVDVVNRARGLSLDGVYVVTAQLLSRYGMGVK
jgi:hypothetical protein